MTDTDLKPRPFCGSENVKSGGDDKIVAGWCENCQAHGPNGYLTINGEFDWNTRADLRPTAVPLCVDTLAQIIREVDGNHTLGASELAARILSTLDLAPVTPAQACFHLTSEMAENCQVCNPGAGTVHQSMTPAQAAIEALNDIACGRGMFGVDGEEDAQWATEYAATTLKAIKEGG